MSLRLDDSTAFPSIDLVKPSVQLFLVLSLYSNNWSIFLCASLLLHRCNKAPFLLVDLNNRGLICWWVIWNHFRLQINFFVFVLNVTNIADCIYCNPHQNFNWKSSLESNWERHRNHYKREPYWISRSSERIENSKQPLPKKIHLN